jgi:hypothetical protein
MPRKNPTLRNRDADRRRDLRCYICRERIPVTTIPWTEVTLTGDTRSWHPTCDHLHKRSEPVPASK